MCISIQLPIGGSVLHLFSSRKVLSTSGENASLMLNSLRTSSGVLSVVRVHLLKKREPHDHSTHRGGVCECACVGQGRGELYPIEKKAHIAVGVTLAELPTSYATCLHRQGSQDWLSCKEPVGMFRHHGDGKPRSFATAVQFVDNGRGGSVYNLFLLRVFVFPAEVV